jgi:hypothetical protein
MSLDNIRPSKPFQYFTNNEIDNIALKLSQEFNKTMVGNTFSLDMDRLVDWLDISIYEDSMNEPEGASFFAGYVPDGDGTIILNQKYRDLFEKRTDIYRNCVGHEVGHFFLRHLEFFSENITPSLFDDVEISRILLHKSSWHQYGLTGTEVKQRVDATEKLVNKLTKNALINNKAHTLLRELQNKFEPEWMFRQAEYFSLCLCIPKNKLQKVMNDVPLKAGWKTLYSYKEAFGTSITAIKTRLKKLDLIDFDKSGVPFPKITPQQTNLF